MTTFAPAPLTADSDAAALARTIEVDRAFAEAWDQAREAVPPRRWAAVPGDREDDGAFVLALGDAAGVKASWSRADLVAAGCILVAAILATPFLV